MDKIGNFKQIIVHFFVLFFFVQTNQPISHPQHPFAYQTGAQRYNSQNQRMPQPNRVSTFSTPAPFTGHQHIRQPVAHNIVQNTTNMRHSSPKQRDEYPHSQGKIKLILLYSMKYGFDSVFYVVENVNRATRVSSKVQAPVYLERPARFLLFLKTFHIFCPDKIYFGYLGHEWTVFLINISFSLFYSTN